jgi:hypothetical protein
LASVIVLITSRAAWADVPVTTAQSSDVAAPDASIDGAVKADAGGDADQIAGRAPANNPTRLFSSREGFNADGRPTPAFEAQLWLYLPAVDATIGLNRPPGTDIVINRPRPTVADVVNHLSFAFTCDCTVRYGDWSADVTVLYVSTKQKTNVPPLPPALPQAVINSTLSVVYVSPGLGYRVLRTDHVSLDLRAGFTYAALNADAEFLAGQFARAASYNPSFIQPWMGERIDYYPTPRWRIENTAALTGIGGPAGWNAKIGVSYLVTSWFDVTLGYRASETKRDLDPRPDGALRNVRILFYGPVAALGFRF